MKSEMVKLLQLTLAVTLRIKSKCANNALFTSLIIIIVIIAREETDQLFDKNNEEDHKLVESLLVVRWGRR